MKYNIILFIVIAALTYGATVYFDHAQPNITVQPATPEETLQGNVVPAFTFKTLDGKAHDIQDFKGRIVILNFWASWCPPCVKEFPDLLKLANNNNDVTLIALSSDLDEEAMNNFLKKYKTKGKNILIALDHDQAITQKIFQTYKLPETIIIDADQIMRIKIAGADWKAAELQKTIESYKK
jgi:cytochrome c biogenesis protein CcmG/thiol:disulfide interchange protein DsbE